MRGRPLTLLPYMKTLTLLSVLLLALGSAARAQSPDSTGPIPASPDQAPTPVPLDGGASLLLASGVAYGLKRLRARRRA
jgi:hypothetical protein